MDKNNIIGFTLIFAILFAWSYLTAPSQEEIEKAKFVQDSTEQVEKRLKAEVADSASATTDTPETIDNIVPPTPGQDSVLAANRANSFGAFAPSANGSEAMSTLENELFKIVFTNKGGRVKSVEIKPYDKLKKNAEGVREASNVILQEDNNNRFEYQLPLRNGQTISTQDLFFDATVKDSTVTFRAKTNTGGYFEQKYTISSQNYNIDYTISHNGIAPLLQTEEDEVRLNWITFLDKIEENVYYERLYSSVYYKEAEESPSYCSCRAEDEQKLEDRVKWISHSNQFFNSSLMADRSFGPATVATVMLEEDDENLKKLTSSIMVPLGSDNGNTFAMKMYVGPNEFDRLRAYDNSLEDIIPYGWSFFGSINRWLIRPLFNLLSGFIGSKGIVILLLTVLVKLALYPLTYKMLHSQSKMAALKPQLTAMGEKFGEDPQKKQMETMKMYREFGVNPLGGCFPIALQMPIWFALYRFFPASIDFRQAGFLWATDLSSYDEFFQLPFELPMGLGAHISLFTLLWAITTLIYTYYNTKHMDMTANPAMKYMQYLMPVMFMGFFNSYASGLTCYLLFSNIFNIAQTVVTKNCIINQDKIKAELEAYRKKPKKKKSGFGARLESALKEQQKVAAKQKEDKADKGKKGGKK
jgi:YidC/Oxa1 family membrane protein insertase